jgi:S-DNA-T family DNA segregation ATPase FtsK/SpoIIIE
VQADGDDLPDKVALLLEEAPQVDIMLGEGARDRGALAYLIDGRVRAAYVSDDDIDAMAAAYSVSAGASS